MVSNKPFVLIVSYHFYPSNEIGARRPTALARFLVAKGVRVSVISAFGGKDIQSGSLILPGIVAVPIQKSSRRLIDVLVAVKKLLTTRHNGLAQTHNSFYQPSSESAPTRSLGTWLRDLYFQVAYFIDDHKSWGRRAVIAATQEGKIHSPTLVLSSSPPLSVSWAGALAAKRLRVPHIVDLRDPWSDVIALLHPDRRIELTLTRAVERCITRHAAAVTSTCATTARRLIARQPEIASKTFIIRNGYDGELLRRPRETAGRLALLFAGELYLNRDPFPLLHAIERLLSYPGIQTERISAVFMGRKTAQLRTHIAEWLEGKRCKAAITLLDPQPAEIVADATRHATVLVNLAQGQPLSIPAKTFEHLASGREVLLLCENDSESAQLVSGLQGVNQVDPRDPDALDRVLLDLYERHVIQGVLRSPTNEDISKFSRTAANECFWRIMIKLSPELIKQTKGLRC